MSNIIEKINNGSKIDLIIFDLDKENFNYISIINGDYFNQDIFKKTENKIDKKLLENIKNANSWFIALWQGALCGCAGFIISIILHCELKFKWLYIKTPKGP